MELMTEPSTPNDGNVEAFINEIDKLFTLLKKISAH